MPREHESGDANNNDFDDNEEDGDSDDNVDQKHAHLQAIGGIAPKEGEAIVVSVLPISAIVHHQVHLGAIFVGKQIKWQYF